MNLTAYNPSNDREISSMFSKAMCAYANWQDTEKNAKTLEATHGKENVALHIAACQSEYEATVRCIALFVKESLPTICRSVIETCEREFWAKDKEPKVESKPTTRLQNFHTGKWVTCENTGKHLFGKVVWRSVKTGKYYERMSPNGRKCGMPYYFHQLDTDWVEANWK